MTSVWRYFLQHVVTILDLSGYSDIQMPPTRNHPQTPVVSKSERSDGRAYHRCIEDERERVAGGGICILYIMVIQLAVDE